jgi:hypothetical protein
MPVFTYSYLRLCPFSPIGYLRLCPFSPTVSSGSLLSSASTSTVQLNSFSGAACFHLRLPQALPDDEIRRSHDVDGSYEATKTLTYFNCARFRLSATSGSLLSSASTSTVQLNSFSGAARRSYEVTKTGGERGIRTLDTLFGVYMISNHALSATQTSLQKF